MNINPTFDVLCSSCKSLLKQISSPELDTSGQNLLCDIATMRGSATLGCHLCNLFMEGLYSKAGFAKSRSFEEQPQMLIYISWSFNVVTKHHGWKPCWLEIEGYDLGGILVCSSHLWLVRMGTREKANILARRSDTSQSLAESSFQQLKGWLSNCLESHDVCQNSWKFVSDQKKLPTRLLEITQKSGSLHVRVVLSHSISSDTEYLTLSHCWGPPPHVSLNSANQASFFQSIPLDSLPSTFRDAIQLTSLLNCRYLWIDSLCIIQDSHEDWVDESSLMGQVYANGFLNIAASAAKTSADGFLSQSTSLLTSPCLVNVGDETKGACEYICYLGYPWLDGVENSPLGKRGWVVQERILSPRVVHFASKQMFWECCQNREAEILSKECLFDSMSLKLLAPVGDTFSTTRCLDLPSIYEYWGYLVNKYSQCNLTFDSDKLVVFSGIARRMCRQFLLEPTDYLAGLWKSDFIFHLLWSTDVDPFDGKDRRCRVLNRAPSWSWASVDGPIYPLSLDEPELFDKFHTNVLDIKIDHDGDPFGLLRGGLVRLEGPLYPLKIKTDQIQRKGASGNSYPSTDLFPQIFIEEVKWDDKESSIVAIDCMPFFLLLATHPRAAETTQACFGLVLHPTGLLRGQFRRLGCIIQKEITYLDEYLRKSTGRSILQGAYYQKADIENGYTIEVI